MADVWQISEAVSLATHTMAYLAQEPGRRATTRQIAEQFGFSQNHLAKVHQRLTRRGLLRTIRGPSGGVELALPPRKVSLLRIYQAIDGEMECGCCTMNTPSCGREHCIFGNLIESVNTQIRNYFQTTTLADLIET